MLEQAPTVTSHPQVPSIFMACSVCNTDELLVFTCEGSNLMSALKACMMHIMKAGRQTHLGLMCWQLLVGNDMALMHPLMCRPILSTTGQWRSSGMSMECRTGDVWQQT